MELILATSTNMYIKKDLLVSVRNDQVRDKLPTEKPVCCALDMYRVNMLLSATRRRAVKVTRKARVYTPVHSAPTRMRVDQDVVKALD